MSERLVSLIVKKNHYPQIADAVRPAVSDAINNGIANFLIVADATVPVDTGNLRANKDIDESSPGTLEGSVTYRANYSVFVHEGTIYQEPQPWAADAIRTIAPSWNREMYDAIHSLEGVR